MMNPGRIPGEIENLGQEERMMIDVASSTVDSSLGFPQRALCTNGLGSRVRPLPLLFLYSILSLEIKGL